MPGERVVPGRSLQCIQQRAQAALLDEPDDEAVRSRPKGRLQAVD